MGLRKSAQPTCEGIHTHSRVTSTCSLSSSEQGKERRAQSVGFAQHGSMQRGGQGWEHGESCSGTPPVPCVCQRVQMMSFTTECQ